MHEFNELSSCRIRSANCSSISQSQKQHGVKSVQIRSFFWFVFSNIPPEYGPNSVRIRENTNQKNSNFMFYLHGKFSANYHQSICKILCFQHIVLNTFRRIRLNHGNYFLKRVLFQILKEMKIFKMKYIKKWKLQVQFR